MVFSILSKTTNLKFDMSLNCYFITNNTFHLKKNVWGCNDVNTQLGYVVMRDEYFPMLHAEDNIHPEGQHTVYRPSRTPPNNIFIIIIMMANQR